MDTNSEPKRAQHIRTKSTPRFGRGIYSDLNPPKTVKSSPFFWWFMFLRLNNDYQETIKNNGIGKCSQLFKDFGDVVNNDFKTWWREHSYLFAETPTQYTFKQAKKFTDLAPFDSSDAINVVVPLSWDQKSLKKYFSLLLTKLGVVQGERGPKIGSNTAIYSIGRRWNCGAMDSAYRVYIARQANLEKGAKETTKPQHKGAVSSKYKVAWADIADMAKLTVSNIDSEGSKRSKAEIRRLQTILAVRHYENAEAFIKSSTTMNFPSTIKD